jgi:hypothetical protein
VANGSIRITGTELMKNTAVKERMKFVCGFKRTGLRTVQHVSGMETAVWSYVMASSENREMRTSKEYVKKRR